MRWSKFRLGKSQSFACVTIVRVYLQSRFIIGDRIGVLKHERISIAALDEGFGIAGRKFDAFGVIGDRFIPSVEAAINKAEPLVRPGVFWIFLDRLIEIRNRFIPIGYPDLGETAV